MGGLRLGCARILANMNPSKVGKIASGVALMVVAMGSAALTLGRTQDVAWVGKPLDALFQVQFENVGDLLPDCLAAEVFYGDTQLDPSRVSVTVSQAPGIVGVQSLRVLTTLPIDEPIVTVQLRIGCQQKLAKRYTLFAELPTNVVEPVVPNAPRSNSGNARVTSIGLPLKPVQYGSADRAPVVVGEPAVAQFKKPRQVKPAVQTTPAFAPAVEPSTRKQSTRVPARSRLKLDSLDLLIERDPILRTSTELLALPREDDPKRTEAAALWRSLNVSPEQLLVDEAKAQSFERDIKSLHAMTTQNQKALIDLAGKVRQAESERYANGLVYILMGLLIAILSGVLWFWRRTRVERASDWLHGQDAQESLLAEIVQSSSKQRSVAAVGESTSSPVVGAGVVTSSVAPAPMTEVDFDFDLDVTEPPGSGTVPPIGPTHSRAAARSESHRDFSVSLPLGTRPFDSEELVDAREQAEFFVSLGQHDKAIDILTTRIAQFGESSPLVCLDLLKIYHALGRETDFEFMRAEFNHWFAGYVPEFSAFGDYGRALEQYPEIMDRISALWPVSVVLEYIEGCLYHHADDGTGEGVVFDLQAYLDLLFLHGVAKQIIRQPQSADAGPMSEALRIPVGAQGTPIDDASQSTDGPVIARRAGAHHRGAQFGTMKYPPTAPPLESTTDLKTQTEARIDRTHTDFNFLGLG